jgi:hypothetical protein
VFMMYVQVLDILDRQRGGLKNFLLKE